MTYTNKTIVKSSTLDDLKYRIKEREERGWKVTSKIQMMHFTNNSTYAVQMTQVIVKEEVTV